MQRALPALADDTASLVVAEVFGPTFQGEGPSLGKRAAFVRLGGCNLHCSWCDTPYTWDSVRYDLRTELNRRKVSDIAEQVSVMTPQVAVITGGEPLLWQPKPGWKDLIWRLSYLAADGVEVETNGTLIPSEDNAVRRYSVSPKLAHAGDPLSRRIVPEALKAFADLAVDDRAILKVVVQTAHDVRQAADLADQLNWPAGAVYVMPEATTPAVLIQRHAELADAALAEGVNMTTRLHVLAWGTERGR